MTTDITELAQSHELRNKVNHRLYGALEFQGTSGEHATVTLSIDECKSIIAAMDERLALVEALEKAQTEVKRQENIASALFDEVSQLRRNADDKAPELKKIITEMEEENNRQVLEVMRLSSLVAELESRTVTVKLPPQIDTSNVQFAGSAWNCCIDEVEKRLTAAGIKWEAE